ncbi:MAG: peptide deformylase [Christensenellaceae bacterium]|jgi:peptide deformylase|nr:peptide deformylase [Christensenellaceae bacterium]
MKQITIWENEPFLRQRSKEVVFPDKDLKGEIEILKDYCYNGGVGVFAMAAVQLGIPKRLIFVMHEEEGTIEKPPRDNRNDVYINPQIVERKGEVTYWEACASLWNKDGDLFAGKVRRPYQIKIKYQDEFGKVKTRTMKDFAAVMFSHEYDHLDGVLHTDKAEEIVFMKRSELRGLRGQRREALSQYMIFSKKGEYKPPEIMPKSYEELKRDYEDLPSEERLKVLGERNGEGENE